MRCLLKLPTKSNAATALFTAAVLLLSLVSYGQPGIMKNVQACSNSLGDAVYSLDFGSGPNFGAPLPPGTTSLNYQANACVNDEFYTIVNNTPGCFDGNWHNLFDHTGNANGYFMLANASMVPSDFFVKTITGLCSGTSYEFAAWLVNVCKLSGILPNITMTIETPTGSVLATYNTGNIPIMNPYQWQQYGFNFTTPTGVTSVVLRMRNNAPGGDGNDVALDDITFRPVGPNIALSVVNYSGTTVNLNPESSEVLQFNSTVESCYPSNAYQWQLSTNNSASWTNITGATNANYLRNPTPPGTYQYRLLVAQTGNLSNASCRVISPIITVNVVQACNLVVNNPVPVCAPATVNLTLPAVTAGSTNLSPLTYWTNAAATTPLANPSAVSVSGTYYIKTEGPGCMEIKPVLVFVNSNQPTSTPTLYCAPSAAFPTSQLIFDWNNNIGETGYSYSYSIDGGPLVYGAQNAPSSYYINLGPGQTVTFNIYWNGLCASQTATCTTGCITTTTTNFAPIAPFCEGSTAPILSNTSPNGVVGTWSPSVVSNTTSGSYVFTPDNACATTQTLNVTVIPRVTPTFTQIGPVCQNSAAFTLPTTSNNSTPITGTWSPAVSTATVGATTYTFTPNPGQCVSATPTTMTVTVLANVVPNFAGVPALCEDSVAPNLPTTSPNGINGTWSPSAINTSSPGTFSYTFTPNAGQCSSTQQLSVTILPNQVPNFSQTLSLCSGSPAPVLQGTSPNGISGTWNPATISNTQSGNYIFTPSPGQCASTRVLTVTIIPTIAPNFPPALSICQGNTPPPLVGTSPNGISGTWSPATISTANIGSSTYTFTANPGQCVSTNTQVFTVDVIPNLQPDFLPIDPFCAGSAAPVLSSTSPNGITGTWSPATINNMTSGTYTFTPASTQCASPQVLTVTVTPKPIPTFDPVPAFCVGAAAPVLPTTSNNGFTGTWSPALVDNTATATYLFTPDAPQCADTASLTITVNQPVMPDFPNISICAGDTPPVLEFQSPNEINGSWMPVVVDNFNSGTYVFTPVPSECAVAQTITVTVNTETLTAVDYTVTNAFSNDQVVTVLASGPGNYLYQLDNGPLQTSNIFLDVQAGTHSVTVYDANGCSTPITNSNVRVINYPAFFTPNGDAYNDTWNVIGLTNEAKVFIFDRHGKLLKQISPTGDGWDGTYNGEPLPSSDYWFTVEYDEQSKSKTFRSHFSLKR